MSTTLLSFLLSYFFIYHTFASAKCLQDQQSLLLQLKNNFTFDPQFSTKLKLWNENTACCNWSGVTCNNEGHVIGLDLSQESIYGGFDDSSTLFSLQYLQKLNLAYNYFNSSIPSGFRKLATLNYLNLSNSHVVRNIPMEISKLTRLNFQGNQLQGPIPRSLFHCSSLEVLDIGSNQIIDHFPCFLNEIPKLSALVLRNNRFHGSIQCSENKPWKSIQIVDIAFNNFNGKLPTQYFKTWERMIYDENVAHDINYNMSRDYPYYHDSVTVTCKGQRQDLVKILTIFKAIDFSFNSFEGRIPLSLMDFKALYVLNFSNNGLTGEIPSSIGNMKQLESLDFSNNSLFGEIPVQLSNLSFLSYLNLSFNNLVGKIPTGTQLQSFPTSSFEGNRGLYGPPLDEIPIGETEDLHPQPACEKLACSTEWNFLCVEFGFVFGLGMIIGPIMFWKKWRVRYWKLLDKILCRIFPWMHLEYATKRGKTYTVLRW
ncbi:receptor-like protein 43 [Vicia villosa]|uniref:receptor-like protein 43 n=1 Tax=Vicia villosa TaxID=3911 RepID=UPI00273CBA24|nr:receptor-like protein 43 [Vicia villosa]